MKSSPFTCIVNISSRPGVVGMPQRPPTYSVRRLFVIILKLSRHITQKIITQLAATLFIQGLFLITIGFNADSMSWTKVAIKAAAQGAPLGTMSKLEGVAYATRYLVLVESK
ncbi:MAG: hypothetical protein ACI8SR_002324 [Oceanicoccus sp.]|jgi:hypothetical protein